MNHYLLGFISALLLVSVVYGTHVYLKSTETKLKPSITTVSDKTGRDGAFEVHADGVRQFQYFVFSNGFMITVPFESESSPQLFYSQTKQSEGMVYTLRTAIMNENGSLEIRTYDLDSGEVSVVTSPLIPGEVK